MEYIQILLMPVAAKQYSKFIDEQNNKYCTDSAKVDLQAVL